MPTPLPHSWPSRVLLRLAVVRGVLVGALAALMFVGLEDRVPPALAFVVGPLVGCLGAGLTAIEVAASRRLASTPGVILWCALGWVLAICGGLCVILQTHYTMGIVRGDGLRYALSGLGQRAARITPEDWLNAAVFTAHQPFLVFARLKTPLRTVQVAAAAAGGLVVGGLLGIPAFHAMLARTYDAMLVGESGFVLIDGIIGALAGLVVSLLYWASDALVRRTAVVEEPAGTQESDAHADRMTE